MADKPETSLNSNTQSTSRLAKKRQMKRLSINTMIPNILTLLALASGLTAVRFALQEQWEFTLIAIAAAAILDALDGRVARLLKGASKFGAELDSLSDFVCFGVSPALILYLWAMEKAGNPGWILALLYAMCMGLRLARFNVAIEDDDQPGWKANFFAGTPAPAAAGLVLLPIILSLEFETDLFRNPWIVSLFLLTVGGLAVSSVPTYSFKKLKIPNRLVLPTMLSVAVFAAFVVSVPWLTLIVILGLYLISIPFSYRAFMRFSQGRAGKQTSADH